MVRFDDAFPQGNAAQASMQDVITELDYMHFHKLPVHFRKLTLHQQACKILSRLWTGLRIHFRKLLAHNDLGPPPNSGVCDSPEPVGRSEQKVRETYATSKKVIVFPEVSVLRARIRGCSSRARKDAGKRLSFAEARPKGVVAKNRLVAVRICGEGMAKARSRNDEPLQQAPLRAQPPGIGAFLGLACNAQCCPTALPRVPVCSSTGIDGSVLALPRSGALRATTARLHGKPGQPASAEVPDNARGQSGGRACGGHRERQWDGGSDSLQRRTPRTSEAGRATGPKDRWVSASSWQ